MTSKERDELLEVLAIRYLIADVNNNVYGRENSEELRYEQGRFEGFLMAFGFSYKFNKLGHEITVLSSQGKLLKKIAI